MSNQPMHVVNGMKDLKYNRIRRLVASEIEVCGLTNATRNLVNSACTKWGANIVSDGSLPPGGFEINTAPAAGNHWINEITDICDALEAEGGWVNERAGCHCHIDARDFTHYDIRRLVILYEKVEPILYSMVPASRRTSRFCIPCGTKYVEGWKNKAPKESKDQVIKNIYNCTGVEAQQRKRTRYDQARYNAMNLHSFFVRGTIECRLLDGTVDKNVIIPWGQMWGGMLDFAYKAKEKDIAAMPADTMQNRLETLLATTKIESVKHLIASRIGLYNPEMTDILHARDGVQTYF